MAIAQATQQRFIAIGGVVITDAAGLVISAIAVASAVVVTDPDGTPRCVVSISGGNPVADGEIVRAAVAAAGLVAVP